jgi:hypothetical protein
LNARRILGALGATLAITLGSGSALASRIPGDVITGPVTAVTRESVTIEGHQYHIRQGSPAASVVPHVTPGQSVEVHLDGPASSSRSEVIHVVVPRRTQ